MSLRTRKGRSQRHRHASLKLWDSTRLCCQNSPIKVERSSKSSNNYAAEAEFAVVVCTPDDIGGLADHGEIIRATCSAERDELGYFVAKYGRKDVSWMLLWNVDFPTEDYGVLHTKLDVILKVRKTTVPTTKKRRNGR